MGVYAYASNEENFDSMGLVGELLCTKCEHDEVGNGYSDLTIVHPIDPAGKWRALAGGNIVKAPTEVRETPEINMSNPTTPLRVTTIEWWLVKSGATKDKRYLWSKAADGKKLKLLPGGLKVTVVAKAEIGKTRHKVKTKYGQGYVEVDALEYDVDQTIPDTNTGIELVQSPYKVKDQLFYIDSVKLDLNNVTVKAKHIFYKQIKNAVNFNATKCTIGEAIAGIRSTCLYPNEFTGYTDMGDTRFVIDWRTWNPVKALLDPEQGVIGRWGGQLVRDNFEYYVLRKAGVNRGVRIEYGKNLTGVDYQEDTDAVYTRIVPIGTAKDGSRLYLDGTIWIDSPRINDYPEPSILILECTDCTVGDNMTTAEARAEMRRQSQQKFDEGCDLPDVSLKIKFQALGWTEEYSQFRDLDKCYLFDIISVILKERFGFDIVAEVVRVKTDCMTGEPIEMDVSSLRKKQATISSFQIPTGINGSKLFYATVGAGALGNDVIEAQHIQADSITADLVRAGAITADKLDATTVNAFVVEAVKGKFGEIATGKLTTDELYAEFAKIVTLAVEQINAETISTDHLYAVLADVIALNLKNGNFEAATIQNLMAQVMSIRKGSAGELYIDNLVVTEASIVSGTMGQLVLKNADGRYFEVIVNSDGTIHTVEVTVTEGEFTAGQTATGKKIIETAINIPELDAKKINGAYANIVEIVTEGLNAGKITAAQAFLTSATIPELYATVIRAIGAVLTLKGPAISMVITGVEEGQEVFRADTGGVYANKITSPTVARRVPGGIYSVGANSDFESLSEAFNWLEGAQIAGDIVLKLTRDDPGGMLRGVMGGYDVLITGANLVNYWDTPIAQGATGAPNAQGSGIIATITSAGGLYNRVIYPLGAVDDLGIRGMDILLRTTITWVSGGNPNAIASLGLYSANYGTLYGSEFGAVGSNTDGTVFRVPTDAPRGARLGLALYPMHGIAATVGAAMEFSGLSVEIGTAPYLLLTKCALLAREVYSHYFFGQKFVDIQIM